jgi:hypothetical protein
MEWRRGLAVWPKPGSQSPLETPSQRCTPHMAPIRRWREATAGTPDVPSPLRTGDRESRGLRPWKELSVRKCRKKHNPFLHCILSRVRIWGRICNLCQGLPESPDPMYCAALFLGGQTLSCVNCQTDAVEQVSTDTLHLKRHLDSEETQFPISVTLSLPGTHSCFSNGSKRHGRCRNNTTFPSIKTSARHHELCNTSLRAGLTLIPTHTRRHSGFAFTYSHLLSAEPSFEPDRADTATRRFDP